MGGVGFWIQSLLGKVFARRHRGRIYDEQAQPDNNSQIQLEEEEMVVEGINEKNSIETAPAADVEKDEPLVAILPSYINRHSG